MLDGRRCSKCSSRSSISPCMRRGSHQSSITRNMPHCSGVKASRGTVCQSEQSWQRQRLLLLSAAPPQETFRFYFLRHIRLFNGSREIQSRPQRNSSYHLSLARWPIGRSLVGSGRHRSPCLDAPTRDQVSTACALVHGQQTAWGFAGEENISWRGARQGKYSEKRKTSSRSRHFRFTPRLWKTCPSDNRGLIPGRRVSFPCCWMAPRA